MSQWYHGAATASTEISHGHITFSLNGWGHRKAASTCYRHVHIIVPSEMSDEHRESMCGKISASPFQIMSMAREKLTQAKTICELGRQRATSSYALGKLTEPAPWRVKAIQGLVNTLEPQYSTLLYKLKSQQVLPVPCQQNKCLSDADLQGSREHFSYLFTNGRTSCTIWSYITVTAEVMTSIWEMKSSVLCIWPLFESENLQLWSFCETNNNSNHRIAAITNNAQRMYVEVGEAWLTQHFEYAL